METLQTINWKQTTESLNEGKRMLKKNRVFFKNKLEALQLGYRPCGHCMPVAYKEWESVNFLTAKAQGR